MKILQCHNFYRYAGGEDTVFVGEGALLESHGHEVVRFTKHNDELGELNSAAILAKTFWNSQSARELQMLIRETRPDVMHCTNNFPLLSPSIYQAARREGVAVVHSLHNYRLICPKAQLVRDSKICESCVGKTFAWPALIHRCYRDSLAATAVVAGMSAYHHVRGTWTNGVDCFITPSSFTREKLIEGGLPGDRIVVKPNFVQRDPGPGAGQGGYLTYVGRLSPEKGVDQLLEAWRLVKRDMGLKILGDGPMADDVRRAAESDSRIDWLGQCTPDKVQAVVGDAAFLVMPSVCYETFGLSIIEAFAKGTPVLVSRLGAMQELVSEGLNGRLFDPTEPADLAEKIEAMIDQPAALVEMRREARAEFERRYTAAANYRQLMRIYERAIESLGEVTQAPKAVANELRPES